MKEIIIRNEVGTELERFKISPDLIQIVIKYLELAERCSKGN